MNIGCPEKRTSWSNGDAEQPTGGVRVISGGIALRQVREALRLTVRQVEKASAKIAETFGSDDYLIPRARLSDIEIKGVLPNIFKLYSLAAIYKRDLNELLGFYGVDLSALPATMAAIELEKTWRFPVLSIPTVRMPVALEEFDPRSTVNIGRLITRWGTVPLPLLASFEKQSLTFGFIGTEDWTMYPLLLPGTFIEIDESKHAVVDAVWRSEYERPIYFLEMRDGYACGWCSLEGNSLHLIPHPLSPVRTKSFRYPTEAEVIGQVVGIAMRLDFRISGPTNLRRAQTEHSEDD